MLTERNSVVTVVLMLVTCSIYWFYWFYVTTAELKEASGEEQLNPTTDLLLNVLSCGLWGLYAEYRNAQVAHRLFQKRGIEHDDKSNAVLIFNVLSVFVGVTWFIGPFLLQEDYNQLAKA
jgi:hypothetical protein